MIQKDEIRQVLESAKALGIEFAELFFEDREETNIPCVETVIQGVKSLRICGAGLYLIQGLSNVYLYTNQVTKEALLDLVKNHNIQSNKLEIIKHDIVKLNPNDLIKYFHLIKN